MAMTSFSVGASLSSGAFSEAMKPASTYAWSIASSVTLFCSGYSAMSVSMSSDVMICFVLSRGFMPERSIMLR